MMVGYRKMLVGLVVLVLATILLMRHLISDVIWERVITWATAIVVGGNVVTNVMGSLGAAIGKAKEAGK